MKLTIRTNGVKTLIEGQCAAGIFESLKPYLSKEKVTPEEDAHRTVYDADAVYKSTHEGMIPLGVGDDIIKIALWKDKTIIYVAM